MQVAPNPPSCMQVARKATETQLLAAVCAAASSRLKRQLPAAQLLVAVTELLGREAGMLHRVAARLLLAIH